MRADLLRCASLANLLHRPQSQVLWDPSHSRGGRPVTSNQQQQPYYADSATPQAALAGRAKFIERTYIHLAGAIALFVALEFVLLRTPATLKLAMQMTGSPTSWLIVLGLFMLVGTVA